MRYLLGAVVTLAVILTANLGRALQSTNFDPVKAEVMQRQSDLPTEPDKEQKKLGKMYAKVLKLFAKDSPSMKKDLALVKKIVAKILKLEDDAVMDDLIETGLDDFLDDIEARIDEAQTALDALSDANKKKAKAQAAIDKAIEGADEAWGELDLNVKSKLTKKAEKLATKSEKKVAKAEKAEGGGGNGGCPGSPLGAGEAFSGTANGEAFGADSVEKAKFDDPIPTTQFIVYNCTDGKLGKLLITLPNPPEVKTYNVSITAGDAQAGWSDTPDEDSFFNVGGASGTVTIAVYDPMTGEADGTVSLSWADPAVTITANFHITLLK